MVSFIIAEWLVNNANQMAHGQNKRFQMRKTNKKQESRNGSIDILIGNHNGRLTHTILLYIKK